MKAHPDVLGVTVSSLSRGYFVAPDHPCKLRVWRFVRRLQANKPFLVRYADRGWLAVDEKCLLQRSIFTTGAYEPEVAAALLERAVDNEVVWDVGANIGSFAVRAALDRRIARLVCCEPDPGNRALLETNLAMNAGAPYRVLPLALSNANGDSVLMPGSVTNRGLSRLAAQGDATTGLAVECRTLDSLVFEAQVPAPTLMKMDVEGWERQVLEGGLQVLHRCPPKAIVFESRCAGDGEIVNRRVPELLSSLGYTISRIARQEPSIDDQENFLAVRTGGKAARD